MLEISAQKHSIIIELQEVDVNITAISRCLRSLYITCVIMRYVTIIRVGKVKGI